MTEQVQTGTRPPEQEVRYIIKEIKLLAKRVREGNLDAHERKIYLRRIASLQRQLQVKRVIE